MRGKTAIVVTHQLEEAIEMGGRILVFGRPGHVLADIHLAGWSTNKLASLRSDIQQMLQSNTPNPRNLEALMEQFNGGRCKNCF